MVLNIILPATLNAVGLDWLAKLVSPLTPQSDGWGGVLAALFEAVVAWWLAGWRIGQRLVGVLRVEGGRGGRSFSHEYKTSPRH